MPPGDLENALCGLEFPTDPNLIVGLDHADDAGVYKINDDLALIQTVDFFTPIADNPYIFGQIATANALSDVYAMGGVPKIAMNIVCFPAKDMDISILREILRGGINKMKEAGVVLAGGHSVEDKELKYGLSVTGFVHPDRILTKRGIKPDDNLILTKAIGTGIINTAIKGGLAPEKIIDTVSDIMAALNRDAATIMLDYPVHACTDITGFGLVGHILEMVSDTGLGVEIKSEAVPVIPEALEYARMGLLPEGAYKNRKFYENKVKIQPDVNRLIVDIFFDPQTSGGLLISVDSDSAEDLIAELREKKVQAAEIIGKVMRSPKGGIVIS